MTTMKRISSENPIKVIMPIGWMAGQETALPLALQLLSMEIMGARSDMIEKQPPATEREQRALDLAERAAFCLGVIAWQLDPQPTTGYTEQAARLGVVLPPDLKD